jgi:hypothetical protein
VSVPADESEELHSIAPLVSYGWGMVPVTAVIESTTWTTALFPKDGGYLVPIKDVVRRQEDLEIGDTVTISLTVDVPSGVNI